MKIRKLETGQDNRVYMVLALVLIALAVLGRLVPHPPNFAPMSAVAIFGGAILPKRWGLSLPLFAMAVSDLIIGLHALFFLTWLSFLGMAWLSSKVLKQLTTGSIIGASLIASTSFYLVSNFGVWLEGRMYAMTLSGLVECYYQALPFFRNTLASDLMFTGLLFSIYALASSTVTAQRSRLRLG